MIVYALRRVLLMVPTLLGVTMLVFGAVRLAPGDTAVVLAGQQATEEILESIRRELGLDRPILVQYADYLWGLARLDMGRSMFSSAPVATEVLERYPVSLALAGASAAVSAGFGVVVGAIAAAKRRSWLDYALMTVVTVGLSVPNFVLALLLVLVFAIYMGVLPATASHGITPAHFVLPVLTLGISAAGVIARQTRSSVLDVMHQDYIRTARAKGLRQSVVLYRHALRNALIPVVTIIGLQFGQFIGRAVIVESVFGLPGIGKLVVDRIIARDYPVVQGAILVAAFSFVLINLAVDLIYGLLDPRIRYTYRTPGMSV